MSFDDEITPPVPTVSGAQEIDAAMFLTILHMLEGARDEPGLIERNVYDVLHATFPDATPTDLNGSIRESRVAGVVVLVDGRLLLDRRITPRQMIFLKSLVDALARRQQLDGRSQRQG
jgi:hypothetical protein